MGNKLLGLIKLAATVFHPPGAVDGDLAIVGNVDIKDALAAFVILGAGAGLGAVSMVKKLRVIWNNNITLRFQRNKPPECFICNLDSCDECEVLRVWRLR